MRLNERLKYENAMNSIRLPQHGGGAGGFSASIGGYPSFRNERMRGVGLASSFNPAGSVPAAAKYSTTAALGNSFGDAFARLKHHRETEHKMASDAAFAADLQKAGEFRRAVESSGVTQLGADNSRGSTSDTRLPFNLIQEWERKYHNLQEQLARAEAQAARTAGGIQARALGMAESEVHAKDQTIFALKQQLQEQAAEVEALKGKMSVGDLRWKDKVKRLEENFEAKARDCEELREKVDQQRVDVDRLKARESDMKQQVSDMKNLVRQAEADLERAAESPELANLRTELARTRRENQTLRSTNAALEDAQADLQQRVTTDVSSMHHLNERVRSLQSQLEQRKLRGAAEEEMTREIEDLRRNLANAKAREDYAKTTIAVEIEAVNQKMAEMQRQLQLEEAKSRQADRLRTALADRERELADFESTSRREADQRDQTERTLRDKLSNSQLDITNLKQQYDTKISHLDRELQAANESALSAKDELFAANQRCDSLTSQLHIAQREASARAVRSSQSEMELQEELKIMEETMERRAAQLKEMKKAHAQETAELRELLEEAKSRDRATAEALHDETSKVVDLQSRLKLSREQALAMESAVRESAERADALQNRLDQRRKQMEEATKATEEQRQALSLENQRLAFDIEALKQKEASLNGNVGSLQKEVAALRAELEAERIKGSERASIAEKKLEAGRVALEEAQLKHIREISALRESGMQIADSASTQIRERFEKANQELVEQLEEARAQCRSDRAAADAAERIAAEKLAAAEIQVQTLQVQMAGLRQELDTARALNSQLRAAESARSATPARQPVQKMQPVDPLPSSPAALGAAAAAFPHTSNSAQARIPEAHDNTVSSRPSKTPAVSSAGAATAPPQLGHPTPSGEKSSGTAVPVAKHGLPVEAAAPTELSRDQLSLLEGFIEELLRADEEGTLSFKGVRLKTCEHFGVSYSSRDWIQWYKETAQRCLDKIQDEEGSGSDFGDDSVEVPTTAPAVPAVAASTASDGDSWEDEDGHSNKKAVPLTEKKSPPAKQGEISPPKIKGSEPDSALDGDADSWDDDDDDDDDGEGNGNKGGWPLNAASPADLTKEQLTQLEQHVYGVLEADENATLSFKQVRLEACAKVPGGPAVYSSSAWKKWFKGTAEKCNDEIEEKRDAEAEAEAAREREEENKRKQAAAEKQKQQQQQQEDDDEGDSWDEEEDDHGHGATDRKKTEEQGQSSPRKQQNGNPKSFVFPPATSPEEISEAHRKVLAAHIRKMLENDDGGTLSFKQVRLDACAKINRTYDTSAWKKWFKATAEEALDIIEAEEDARAEKEAASTSKAVVGKSDDGNFDDSFDKDDGDNQHGGQKKQFNQDKKKAKDTKKGGHVADKPKSVKLGDNPGECSAEALKAARKFVYNLLLDDTEGTLSTKKLRIMTAEAMAKNPAGKLNTADWKAWFKTTANECLDEIDGLEDGDVGAESPVPLSVPTPQKAVAAPDHDDEGPDRSAPAYLKRLTEFIFKVVEEDEEGMITMKDVRAKVAENFNNNDFSSKPWRKWMKTSVQDAIDRLEEMTDPEPMASPPASAAASPKKKNDGAALKPAPGVDTCSDQFIDDAEDIVQEALDEHRDSKKKGVVDEAAVRKRMAKALKVSFEAKEWVRWVRETIEDFAQDDEESVSESNHGASKKKNNGAEKKTDKKQKADPWEGHGKAAPKNPRKASKELLDRIKAILKKEVAKDIDGKMEIDDFQDKVEDAMGQVYKGDEWGDWFDEMVNKFDAELHP